MSKLVWSLTGDEINLVPCNNELYEYFVAQLESHDINRYVAPHLDHSDLFACLDESLSVVNRLLTDKFKISTFDIQAPNWHDQTQLNYLHRSWVILHQQHPNISSVCESVKEGSSKHFYMLNKLIHSAEEKFDEFTLINDTDSFTNIFDYDLTTVGTTGLMINYNNLGRSTFGKWINFDSKDIEIDTNNFKEIYTELTMSLSRPRTYTVPKEYNNNHLLGDKIGLANFDKLEENLLNYRQLVYKNFRLASNFIELH